MLLLPTSELFFTTILHGPQREQPLCWEGVFTSPFHSNGSCSIVACVFAAAGMCLPSRWVAMDVSSDFTIPDFGRHVTISSLVSILVHLNQFTC
jgi:hypothetical protein